MRRSVAPFRVKTAFCQAISIMMVVLLAGCSGPLIKSAITSNIVQEEAHNAYLLLNIIRAQERMPMHFTQVNTVRAAPGGIGIGTPAFGLELPFGGGASNVYKLTPSLEAASNVDSVSLVSQEFTRGITTPVREGLMEYFINQGWPQAMVFHLFIGSMEVVDKSGRVLYSIHNSPFDESFNTFREVVSALSKCRTTLQEQSDYTFHTPPLSESEAKSWLKDVAALKAAGLIAVQVDEFGKPVSAEGAKKGLVRYASRSTESALVFTRFTPDLAGDTFATQACNVEIKAESEAIVRTLMNEFRKQNAARLNQTSAKTSQPSLHVRFVMRSTQSMLYFLGELNRANLANKPPLTIPVRAYPAAKLFEARCCDELPDAAVVVEYRSKRYSLRKIPSMTDTAPDNDRSLQTLALVSLVYGLQNQSGEAPGIRNVRVIP